MGPLAPLLVIGNPRAPRNRRKPKTFKLSAKKNPRKKKPQSAAAWEKARAKQRKDMQRYYQPVEPVKARKNPRRRKAKSTKVRARRNPISKLRARRNPIRKVRARRNPLARIRARRNPLGEGYIKSVATPAMYGVAGALGLAVVYGSVQSKLPASMQSGQKGAILASLGIALGLGVLGEKLFGAAKSEQMVIGALTAIGLTYTIPALQERNIPAQLGNVGGKLNGKLQGMGNPLNRRRMPIAPAMGMGALPAQRARLIRQNQGMGAVIGRSTPSFMRPQLMGAVNRRSR